MKFRALHDGRRIPVIGIGTAHIDPEGAEDEAALHALERGIRLGLTHIDTAEIYGAGHSEILVGEVIRSFPREELFITTKLARRHLRYDQVRAAIEGSLARLDTDYVDLYLIHGPDPSVPQQETFRALNELVDEGLVKYVGVSNYSVEQMREALRYAHYGLATNQVHYSLAHRLPEQNGVLAFCEEHDMLLTAYSPLEVGRLIESPVLEQVARRHRATTPQVALAWLLRQPRVITIPMSTNAEHIAEDAAAAELELSDEDIQALDQEAAPVRR